MAEIEIGDVYDWKEFPGHTMEVERIGRKNAYILVTNPDGATWHKWQPMPFPSTFLKREK